jgi:hypothetical protein
MSLKPFLVGVFVLGVSATAFSQGMNVGPPASTPDATMVLVELTKISRSVQTLGESFKVFADKFETPRGSTLNEKQQKMLLAMNTLVAAEQRVSTFQNQQIDLVQKLNDSRSKLAQVEMDLRPRNIDRSVQFEGTTETEELRDAKRQKLNTERTTLGQLISQIQSQLIDVSDNLREAQSFATRLRKLILPQIERELADQ